MRRRRLVILLLACLGLLLLATQIGRTRWRPGEALPFTVIGEGASLRHLQYPYDPQTKLLVITTPAAIDTLAHTPAFMVADLPPPTQISVFLDRLQTVQYQHDIAIVVLEGMRHPHPGFHIDDVRRAGDQVAVYISFTQGKQWYDWILGQRVSLPMVFDPYRVITIPKPADMASGTTLTITLIADNEQVYQEEVRMP